MVIQKKPGSNHVEVDVRQLVYASKNSTSFHQITLIRPNIYYPICFCRSQSVCNLIRQLVGIVPTTQSLNNDDGTHSAKFRPKLRIQVVLFL